MREHILLECEALLSDNEAAYAEPLNELARSLVQLLAPQPLNPLNPNNIILALQKGFANGIAELEAAGYSASNLSVFDYWYKLEYLEKRRTSTNS